MSELWVKGTQQKGSLGLPVEADNVESELTQILGDWVSVAHSRGTMAAVKADGTLWTCGKNYYGLLGNGSDGDEFGLPAQYEFAQVGEVCIWEKVWGGDPGTFHALRRDGTLWAWGNNGQQPYLGTGTEDEAPFSYNVPTRVPGYYGQLKNVVVGDFATWFLFEDGRLKACGSNLHGNLLDDGDSGLKYYTPLEITPDVDGEPGYDGVHFTLNQISAIAGGFSTQLALEIGDGIYYWNYNSSRFAVPFEFYDTGFSDEDPVFMPPQGGHDYGTLVVGGYLCAFDGDVDNPPDNFRIVVVAESSWNRCSAAQAGWIFASKADRSVWAAAQDESSAFTEIVPASTFTADIYELINADTDRYGDTNGAVAVLIGEPVLAAPTCIGQFLYKDFRFPFTTSGRAVQRLMKIELERNRRQRTIDFPAKLTAFRLLPWDGMYLNHARYGFTAEQHRVMGWKLSEDGGVDLSLQADDADVYAWDRLTDEQEITAIQEVTVPDGSIPTPTVVVTDPPTDPEYLFIRAAWSHTIGAVAYDTYYRGHGDPDWILNGRIADNFFSVSHAGVARDFMVQAVGSSGQLSGEGENIAPGPPTSLAFSTPNITWTNDATAVEVQIFLSDVDDFTMTVLHATVDGTDETFTATLNGYYFLRSVNALTSNGIGNVSVETASIHVTGL